MPLLIFMPGGIELVLLALLLVPLIALIDILRSQFASPNDKILWVLVVLLLPFIGSILYFVMGRSGKLR